MKSTNAKFTCPQCRKEFTRRNNLSRHMRTAHRGKRFVCDKCTKSFSRNEDLKKHQCALQQGFVEYRCSKCPWVFPSPRELGVHFRRIHSSALVDCSSNMATTRSQSVGCSRLSLDSCLPKDIQLAIQPALRYMVKSYNVATSLTENSITFSIVFDTSKPSLLSGSSEVLYNSSAGLSVEPDSTDQLNKQQRLDVRLEALSPPILDYHPIQGSYSSTPAPALTQPSMVIDYTTTPASAQATMVDNTALALAQPSTMFDLTSAPSEQGQNLNLANLSTNITNTPVPVTSVSMTGKSQSPRAAHHTSSSTVVTQTSLVQSTATTQNKTVRNVHQTQLVAANRAPPPQTNLIGKTQFVQQELVPNSKYDIVVPTEKRVQTSCKQRNIAPSPQVSTSTSSAQHLTKGVVTCGASPRPEDIGEETDGEDSWFLISESSSDDDDNVHNITDKYIKSENVDEDEDEGQQSSVEKRKETENGNDSESEVDDKMTIATLSPDVNDARNIPEDQLQSDDLFIALGEIISHKRVAVIQLERCDGNDWRSIFNCKRKGKQSRQLKDCPIEGCLTRVKRLDIHMKRMHPTAK